MLPSGMPSHHTDLFLPRYRALSQGEWRIDIVPMSLSPGYWSPAQLVSDMAVLVRRGSTWMSTSPMELESQEIGIRLSRGHVVIFGLGMGWCALNCAMRDEVEAVTVVELDPDVLALHRELDLAAQLPPEARAKINIVHGDAYAYVPDRPVDLLMPDIWLPLMNDGRVEEVRAMQANVAAKAVYFWGQELEIARHALAAGRALDKAGVATTIAELGLPLLGATLPDYAETIAKAAKAHLERASSRSISAL